ncbi:MAG: acryloyl-CoA reductase [Anaerolineae bacterium]
MTFDTAFDAVIDACAAAPRAGRTARRPGRGSRRRWRAPTSACTLGVAHSAEAWRGDALVGGLYGVSLGVCSPASRCSRASRMRPRRRSSCWSATCARWGIDLVDVQVETPHLVRFGAEPWPRDAFLARLAEAMRRPTRRGPWRVDGSDGDGDDDTDGDSVDGSDGDGNGGDGGRRRLSVASFARGAVPEARTNPAVAAVRSAARRPWATKGRPPTMTASPLATAIPLFRALVVTRGDDGAQGPATLRTVTAADLPTWPDDGDVVVDIAYSSLNYKDGLAVTGRGPIRAASRSYRASTWPARVRAVGPAAAAAGLAVGDDVLVTGWGVGETFSGGYAEVGLVRADWVVPLPAGMDARTAMALGTAGFTAALAVMALEDHGVRPADGDVVVTGAAGGVGSVATALLAAAGYRVLASTGRAAEADYLRSLGAAEIIDRARLGGGPAQPLDKARYAGAVDSVGGDTLAALLAQTKTHGAVASCGLAGGSELRTTVFPFILRGVSLLGIDSNTCPTPRRRAAWDRLAHGLPRPLLAAMTAERPLSEIGALAEAIVAGGVRGRVVIDVHG